MDNNLKNILFFLKEIDKMKSIFRQNILIDKTRQENDAEHSWHLAMFSIMLLDYIDYKVDLLKVLKMVLIHDLVEIYAGDTFCYDEELNKTKEIREKNAMDKIYSILSNKQGEEIKSLWLEFEEMKSYEALYANALDRFQPIFLNHNTNGHSWRLNNVNKINILKRVEPIKIGIPRLYNYILEIIDENIKLGNIIDC